VPTWKVELIPEACEDFKGLDGSVKQKDSGHQITRRSRLRDTEHSNNSNKPSLTPTNDPVKTGVVERYRPGSRHR